MVERDFNKKRNLNTYEDRGESAIVYHQKKKKISAGQRHDTFSYKPAQSHIKRGPLHVLYG